MFSGFIIFWLAQASWEHFLSEYNSVSGDTSCQIFILNLRKLQTMDFESTFFPHMNQCNMSR